MEQRVRDVGFLLERAARGGERRLVPIALDRDAGEMRGALDELEIVAVRRPWLAIVHRERTEAGTIVAEDRRRPAGPQTVTHRDLAEVSPQRILRDVGDDDALAPKRRGAARADGRADHDSV